MPLGFGASYAKKRDFEHFAKSVSDASKKQHLLLSGYHVGFGYPKTPQNFNFLQCKGMNNAKILAETNSVPFEFFAIFSEK